MFDSLSPPSINTDQPLSTFTNSDVPCSTHTQRSGHFPRIFFILHFMLRYALLGCGHSYYLPFYIYFSSLRLYVHCQGTSTPGFCWVGVLMDCNPKQKKKRVCNTNGRRTGMVQGGGNMIMFNREVRE